MPSCCANGVFQDVSEREEEQGNMRKSKEKQRDDEDTQNYRQWMKKAGMPKWWIRTVLYLMGDMFTSWVT